MPDQEMEAPKEDKKKGGKLKWIIIIVVLLGILGGGGWFAYTKFFAAKPDAAEQTENGDQAQDGDTKADDDTENLESEMVSLKAFVVNLADPLGRRYLKLNLDVEVKSKEVADELVKAEPKVRDAVILLLSSKTFADLQSYDAKLQLKNELVERINQQVGPSKVLRVYFTEMVVQ